MEFWVRTIAWFWDFVSGDYRSQLSLTVMIIYNQLSILGIYTRIAHPMFILEFPKPHYECVFTGLKNAYKYRVDKLHKVWIQILISNRKHIEKWDVNRRRRLSSKG